MGGGRVLDPHPPRHRRFRADVITALEALARGAPTDLLLRTLADGLPHKWPEVLKVSGLPEEAAAEALAELTAAGRAITLAARPEDAVACNSSAAPDVMTSSSHVITAEGWEKLAEKLMAALAGYHRRYPLRTWMPREELRSRLKLGSDAFDALVVASVAGGLVAVSEAGARLSAHQPVLPPAQERQARRWLAEITAAPYSPPPPDLDPEVLGLLLEQGSVARVGPDVFFASDVYHEMVGWVRSQTAGGGSLTLAQFRDRFGSSRKYAQALLEHLDDRKVTRRVGDTRVAY
jgi:selenocysteine-specific elongation factor